MCYDPDAAPPAHDTPITTATSAPLTLISTDGTRFAAFHARPADPSGIGVLILPDNRGLRRFYDQLAIRLAEQGHESLAIDYFGRTDGVVGRDRGEEFPVMEHLGRLTRDGLYGDFTAAADHLRGGCATVVAIGFCMGGRFAFLTAAPEFGFAGAVGFYGWTEPLHGAPGPTQLVTGRTAPILGIFGGADEGIPPEAIAAFDRALTEAGVAHEIVIYPGAPHGFFDASQSGHETACADAWERVLGFLRRVG